MSRLPDGMANGPSRSEDLENDAQIWERPWTLEEMRQSSANWSLAADSGVSQKCLHHLWYGLRRTSQINKVLQKCFRNYSRLKGLWNVFCFYLLLNGSNSATTAVFTALPVPPRLLPENAVKDTWDWKAVGQSNPRHQGHRQLLTFCLQWLSHALQYTVYRKCNVYHFNI